MTDGATLIAGSKGARYVTREQLAEYIPPPSTDTYTSVSHSQLVDTLTRVMQDRALFIEKEQYVVDKGGSRLFGCFDLTWQKMEEYGTALAFRQATDRSMSIQIALGLRVFCCSNMSMSGEMISVRKHTSRLQLDEEMDRAMFKYMNGYRRFLDDVHVQENTPVDYDRGKALIYDIFQQKIVPLKLFHPISHDWDVTENRTAWTLHNAATAHIKQLQPAPAFRATARLGKFMASKF